MRAVHRAFARQDPTPAVDQRAAERSGVQSHRDLIGKSGQHATLDRPGRRFAGFQIESVIARDPEKLVGQLRGFTRRANRARDLPW